MTDHDEPHPLLDPEPVTTEAYRRALVLLAQRAYLAKQEATRA